MSFFGTPLTERYNNPGALEFQDWMGKYGARRGANGRYAEFDTPDAGYGVMSKVLDTYQNKHGLNTVAGIVNRWAPANVDNNSTGTYTQKVASALGIDPNTPLTPEQRPALMRAMASYESGRAAPMPGNAAPQSGQQPMRQPYPWMGLPWPQGDGQDVGALNPGMQGGPMVAPRPGAQGFFDAAMPAEIAPEMQAPPMPPPRGPQGGMGSPMAMGGTVPRETSSEQGPGFIQRMSMNPLVMGGIMMALDASRGGSGIDGFKTGAGSASGIQDAYMKNWQLQQKMQQEKALRELMASDQMRDTPQGLRALTAITSDPSLIGQYLARDPLDSQHKRLQNDVLQRQLNAPPDDGSKLMEVNGSIVRVSRDGKATPVYGSDPTTQRRQQLLAAKMDPDTPSSKIFIATGKMPREDQQPLTAGDKKAILEADSNVMSTQNVLTLLKEAEELNPKTNTGWTAGIRASIGNNLPDWLVPDAISSKESSRATTNFENLTVGQALSQLKSTFGAAPTEGERKILMDLQGSVNQPVEVRKDILRRAKMLAEKRLQEQQGIADGLRGGTFYKQGGAKPPTAAGGSAASTTPAPAAVLSEARAAIQRGAPREAVLQRLRDNGIDPAGL